MFEQRQLLFFPKLLRGILVHQIFLEENFTSSSSLNYYYYYYDYNLSNKFKQKQEFARKMVKIDILNTDLRC